jgi:hypothetical protein
LTLTTASTSSPPGRERALRGRKRVDLEGAPAKVQVTAADAHLERRVEVRVDAARGVRERQAADVHPGGLRLRGDRGRRLRDRRGGDGEPEREQEQRESQHGSALPARRAAGGRSYGGEPCT